MKMKPAAKKSCAKKSESKKPAKKTLAKAKKRAEKAEVANTFPHVKPVKADMYKTLRGVRK